MQQTYIFSTTNRILNRVSTVLVCNYLEFTVIQFRIKEVVLSISLCKLWLGLTLELLTLCESSVTLLLPNLAPLLFLKQKVDL